MSILELTNDIIIDIFGRLYNFDYIAHEDEAIRKYDRVSPFVRTCRRICDIYFTSLRSFNPVYKGYVEADFSRRGSNNETLSTYMCSNFLLDALIYSPFQHHLLLPQLPNNKMLHVKKAISDCNPCIKYFEFCECGEKKDSFSLCLTSLTSLVRLNISNPTMITLSAIASVPETLRYLSLRDVDKSMSSELSTALRLMKANLVSIKISFKSLRLTLDKKCKMLMYVEREKKGTTPLSNSPHRMALDFALHALQCDFLFGFFVSQAPPDFNFQRGYDAKKLYYSHKTDLNRWHYLSRQCVMDGPLSTVCRGEFEVDPDDREKVLEVIQPDMGDAFHCTYVENSFLKRLPRRESHERVGHQANIVLRSTFEAADVLEIYNSLNVLRGSVNLKDIRALEIGPIRRLWIHENESRILSSINQLDASKLPNLTVLRLGDPEYILQFPEANNVYKYHLLVVGRVLQTAKSLQVVDIHGVFLDALFQKKDDDSIFRHLGQMQVLNVYGALSNKKRCGHGRSSWESTPFLKTVSRLLSCLERYCPLLRSIKLWDRPGSADREVVRVNKRVLVNTLNNVLLFLQNNPVVKGNDFLDRLLSWNEEIENCISLDDVPDKDMDYDLSFS